MTAAGRTGPEELERLAAECRQVLIEMVHLAGSGHLGSSLSCMDILAVLVFDQLHRDRGDVFVLSKGHAVPAWYAALVVAGELAPELTKSFRTLDSSLQGHPDRSRLDLVDVSTGGLGQGLSVGLGRAEARRLRGQDSVVYCLTGDGELQEGQVWEAVMYAGARKLGNVVLVVDANGSQNDGPLVLPLDLGPVFDSFGWHVQEVDGHSTTGLQDALTLARASRDRPSVVIARTRKGRLGPDRILLDGAHSGVLTQTECRDALEYLRSGR